MIMDWLINIGILIVNAIFDMLDILPNMPLELMIIVNDVFQFLLDGIDLANIFVDVRVISILIPIYIAIVNADTTYKIIMWVLKKIPIVGIE